MNILARLQCIEPYVAVRTTKQLSRIVMAMLVMTGRVSMLGIARWAGKGGAIGRCNVFMRQSFRGRLCFGSFFASICGE